MNTRREFVNYLLIGVTAFAMSLVAISCGSKPTPDAELEPSPEWPPKD